MKIQVLWVPPAERRFGSGDILTSDELAALGVSAEALLAAGEAQVIEPLDHDANGKKGGSRPRKKGAE